ncbi:MAG: MBL fold metallo-hydrolase [Candidatus Sericytochromatia bacterium]|nr:MBL fold metallo-hydrolase [Candidatus Sericytochromatia bacterium]
MQEPGTLADVLPLEDEAGDILAKARSGLGMERPELASALGVPESVIIAWEALTVPIPADHAERLARLLDLRPGAFTALATGTWQPEPVDEPEDGWQTLRFTLSATPGGYTSNTWIVIHPDRQAAWLVDPGFRPEVPEAWLRRHGVVLRGILVTHGHRDHVGGARWLAQETGTDVWLHPADHALAQSSGADGPFHDPRDLRHAEVGLLATPGHTAGGTTWRIGDRLFPGDTMFAASLGRTFGGPADHPEHRRSLHLLLEQPPETLLLPGHGPATTAARERMRNPFAPARPD